MTCFYWFVALNQHASYNYFLSQYFWYRFIQTTLKPNIWRMLIKQDAFRKMRLGYSGNWLFFFAKNDFELDFAQGWAFLQKSWFLTFPALHISFWTFEIQKNVGLSKDFCMILTIFDSFIYVLSFCLNYLLARDYVDINNKLIFLHVFEEYLMLFFQKTPLS